MKRRYTHRSTIRFPPTRGHHPHRCALRVRTPDGRLTSNTLTIRAR